MSRSAVRWVVVGLVAAAGALLYTGYARDRDYSRLIAAGDQAVQAADLDHALEAYSGAIALRPTSMLAHLKRGRTYRERQQYEPAARDLRRAVELDATAILAHELLGDTYLSLGRFDRAAECFRTYLTVDDRSAAIYYKLALAHYRGGQGDRVAEPLDRAVMLDPSLAEAHLLLGLSLRDRGQLGRARAALERATRVAPGSTAPREALASLYATIGDHSRAIDQYEALAALDPLAPDRMVALAEAHVQRRRFDAALLTLQRAAERFPQNPAISGTLGRVWLDASTARGDAAALNHAITALTSAAGHADVSSQTLTDLGRAWQALGDRAAAERALRQAISRQPVAPEAYWHLAQVVARDRRADARDALIRYVALTGDTAQTAAIATDIAAHSLELGDLDVALSWIERAANQDELTPRLADLRRRVLGARAH